MGIQPWPSPLCLHVPRACGWLDLIVWLVWCWAFVIVSSRARHIDSFFFFSRCPVEIFFFSGVNMLGKCFFTEVIPSLLGDSNHHLWDLWLCAGVWGTVASVFSCIGQILARGLWLNGSWWFFFLLVFVTRSYCVAQADLELTLPKLALNSWHSTHLNLPNAGNTDCKLQFFLLLVQSISACCVFSCSFCPPFLRGGDAFHAARKRDAWDSVSLPKETLDLCYGEELVSITFKMLFLNLSIGVVAEDHPAPS